MAENERQRIDVQPSLGPVRIPRRVMNELCAHALESQPEECCGLVSGSAPGSEGPTDRFSRVHRCRNEMSARHSSDPRSFPRDGRRAYFMNEFDYLRAEKEAETTGGVVTAVYHSHVGAGVHFSAMDQEFVESAFFPFPEASQIVLSVWDGRVSDAGIFERDPTSGRVVGAPLAVMPE
jgi:proteasome lid subunit RPN8/RPN11